MNKYLRFGAMIATSTLVMFGLMYLNTYALEHATFSQTRAWMALMMGATMAVVMLAFMLHMYQRKGLNLAIFALSAVLFAASLWLVRSQNTVGDVSWMKAMIPHHSIAILTSERALLADPRVRQLANGIIETQRKEIAEMQALIGRPVFLLSGVEKVGTSGLRFGKDTLPGFCQSPAGQRSSNLKTVRLLVQYRPAPWRDR